MDDKYKWAWEMAISRFKELCEIDSFHGIQFKKHLVTLESIIEYMEECMEVMENGNK